MKTRQRAFTLANPLLSSSFLPGLLFHLFPFPSQPVWCLGCSLHPGWLKLFVLPAAHTQKSDYWDVLPFRDLSWVENEYDMARGESYYAKAMVKLAYNEARLSVKRRPPSAPSAHRRRCDGWELPLTFHCSGDSIRQEGCSGF